MQKRNQVSSANGVCAGEEVNSSGASSSRLACTATLCSSSVDSLIQTRSPRRSACSRMMPSYSEPPTKRKLFDPRRNTVASSINPPVSLHIAV